MKPFQEQSYYELLEVSPRASMDEIRSAYDRATELYAPDSVAMYTLEDPSMGDELRSRIREAMEILTDEDLRQEYDRMIGLVTRGAPADVLRRENHGEDEEADADEAPGDLHDTARNPIPPLDVPPPAMDSTRREVRVAYARQQDEGRRADPLRAPPEPRGPPPEPRPSPRNQARLDSAQVLASENAIADAESAMAQVAAKVKETPRPKSLEIPPDADFSGELLRRIREARGYSLQQVADRTRIGSRHLQNIEADRYSDLPATVYLRGMLQSLAREIGLDPQRVTKSYLTLAKR